MGYLVLSRLISNYKAKVRATLRQKGGEIILGVEKYFQRSAVRLKTVTTYFLSVSLQLSCFPHPTKTKYAFYDNALQIAMLCYGYSR